jgi:heptosyltransferase-2
VQAVSVALRAPNWLGDAVMALPAIEAVARAESETVRIIALPVVAPVFSEFKVIRARRGLDTASFRAARDAGAERVILLTHSFATAAGAALAGIPERIGYRRHFRGPLLTRRIERVKGFVHQIDEYRHLVSECGYAPSAEPPRMASPGTSPIVGDYVVLAPGAKYGSAKRWTGFGGLAAALARSGRRVVVLGAHGEDIRDAPSDPLIENRVGSTSIEEAIAIVAGAAAVVSNDSGLAHVGRALSCRTIVIFGPTEPKRTAPEGAAIIVGEAECAPCLLRTCPIDHRCMRSITVERVMERLA